MPFYWPGECARCLLNLTVATEMKAKCRGCAVDSGGYVEGFDNPQRMCHLDHPPAGLRRSLRARLKGTPPGTSYVKQLVDALRGRKVYYFGDSLAVQFKNFLGQRALEMGVDRATFLAPMKLSSDASGPAFYDHMVLSETAQGQDMWDAWEAQFLHKLQLVLKGLNEDGALVVYNAGLHSGPRNGLMGGGVTEDEQVHMEREYGTVVQHTLGMLEKVARWPSRNASKPFVSVFMETTAQHFPHTQGDFFLAARPPAAVQRSLDEHGRGVHGVEHSACVADTCADRATAGPWPKAWRNRVAADEANNPRWGHSRVFVAPLGDVTVALSDAHIIAETFKRGKSVGWGSECTHFCYSPGLAEAVAYLLLTAVSAVDRRVPPRDLAWRPPGEGALEGLPPSR
jgi:hypothetical protein